MPPHTLLLKTSTNIMLLHNLNPKNELCNGTRMIVENFSRSPITARIISECNRGDLGIIKGIILEPSEKNLGFILRGRKLPVIPVFTITINRSQGQT